MSIFAVIACLGLLQTLFVFSLVRNGWVRLLLGLLVGFACFAIHPWVLKVNYLRFDQFLHSDAALFFITSVLFIESIVKGIFNLNEKASCKSHHWINKSLHACFIYGSSLVSNAPSLMLGFFLFFSLSYCFHHSETTPFSIIAGSIATGLFLLLIFGTFILRLLLKEEQLRATVFKLLFIQLILAISLPLLNSGTNTLPLLYSDSIYVQSLATGVSMLIVTLVGLAIYHFTHNRTRA